MKNKTANLATATLPLPLPLPLPFNSAKIESKSASLPKKCKKTTKNE
jgi:hypothetical protein